jgi:hypothetical protein
VFQLEDTLYESVFESIQATVTRGNIKGKSVRDYFAKYFSHHTELCLGSTIKLDLESDIPRKSIDLC